jgi:hypothetical protein
MFLNATSNKLCIFSDVRIFPNEQNPTDSKTGAFAYNNSTTWATTTAILLNM